MILKKNKYLALFITFIILASCSTTSKNLEINSPEPETRDSKDFKEIMDYQSYSLYDLETIQRIIEIDILDEKQLRDAKLLKNNYQKILSKKKYSLELKLDQQYSKEIIELIYKLNLPVKILWSEKKQSSLPENLLTDKINGFCSSIYDDAIDSINKAINKKSNSILVIYSKEYEFIIKDLKSNNSNFMTVEYDSTNFQEFSAKVFGINFSEKRFKKISNLNPNQNLNFIPRSRSDLNQVIILLRPQEYKSMIPALRYHGDNHFEYFNFISSLENITNPLQLLDYEDSWTPISRYVTRKIQKDKLTALEKFLELGALHEWLLVEFLKQAGVQSANINGVTGSIIFQPNSCSKRIIPLQKISSDLFSSYSRRSLSIKDRLS